MVMLLLVGEPVADRPASPPRRPACAHIDTGRVSMSHVPADARETPAEVLDEGVVLRRGGFPSRLLAGRHDQAESSVIGDAFEEADGWAVVRAIAVCTRSIAPQGPITQNGQK